MSFSNICASCRRPVEKVIRWLDGVAEEKLFLSVITVGEIQHGMERLSVIRNPLSVFADSGQRKALN